MWDGSALKASLRFMAEVYDRYGYSNSDVAQWLVSRCEILKWQIPGPADPVNADTYRTDSKTSTHSHSAFATEASKSLLTCH